uniref:Cadam10_VEGF-1 n=1 Tax=Crotalus adamanteus TaxID=8729 RepID=A0A1W7RB67_CROAD
MAAYLLAVAILFCIQGWPSGTVQGQVMPFKEVYERSVCQTREMLVSILDEHPDETSHLFRPFCVPVLRCGGCCTAESLTCTATGKRSVGSGDHAGGSPEGDFEDRGDAIHGAHGV